MLVQRPGVKDYLASGMQEDGSWNIFLKAAELSYRMGETGGPCWCDFIYGFFPLNFLCNSFSSSFTCFCFTPIVGLLSTFLVCREQQPRNIQKTCAALIQTRTTCSEKKMSNGSKVQLFALYFHLVCTSTYHFSGISMKGMLGHVGKMVTCFEVLATLRVGGGPCCDLGDSQVTPSKNANV